VVVGSDHGLCGRFNEDLAEFAARSLAKPAAAGRLRTLVIGERMAALLGQARLPVETVLPTAGSAARIPDTVDRVLLGIDEWHSTRHIDVVHLLYSRRRTGERSVPAAQRILPVDLRHLRRPAAPPWPSHVLPTYRMPRDELLAALVRQYLFVALCRGCAESHAAEHASRLSAMERAEHNLDERRASLVTRFRRQRQSVITAELLDVVGGYEALQTEGEPR
jgi:F-type H+-transporting ATPase subunit gamma